MFCFKPLVQFNYNLHALFGTMDVIVFLLFLIPCFALNSKIHRERQKRNLLFTPKNNIVQLILGTGIPVPLEGTQALTIGYVLKSAYLTPNNASVFTNPYVTMQKRSISSQKATRFDIYRSLEENFVMFGGKGCVLRAICESARIPFRGSSLIGQILHIIFTPSSTNEISAKPADQLYEAASRISSSEDVSCTDLFPECKKSLLDIVSVQA